MKWLKTRMQFSLCALLIVVTLFAVGLGFWALLFPPVQPIPSDGIVTKAFWNPQGLVYLEIYDDEVQPDHLFAVYDSDPAQSEKDGYKGLVIVRRISPERVRGHIQKEGGANRIMPGDVLRRIELPKNGG